MLSRFRKISLLFFTVTLLTARADNGMWLPHQLSELDLQKLGLKMDPRDFYREGSPTLINAIVSFGGGTGSFVSSQGLILTNHHVAFSALQRASDVQNDYLKNGFLANSKEQEMPAAGTYVDILLGYQEVTNQIVKELRFNMSPRERYEVIEKVSKKLIKETESKGLDIRAKVAEIFGGRNYFLYTFKRIKDVRLVYAPPLNLGNFGGEVDNWMWPRHTADFAFFRAYVSTDNIGSEYHPQNIPYKPQSYLKISLDGIQPGDFTVVMGYPGKTYRQLTVAEFQLAKEQLEERAAKYQECIDFYEHASQNNHQLELRYASKLRSLHNSLKNLSGKLAGFTGMDIDQKKTQDESRFINWFESDPNRQKTYQNILKNISLLAIEKKNNQDKMTILNDWVNFRIGPAMLYQAHLLYRTLLERQKPDIDRNPEFQEREYPSIRNKIRLAERGFDFQTDRSYFLHRLQTLQRLSPEKLPVVLKSLLSSSSNLNSLVDSLYNNSQIQETTKRLEFFEEDLPSFLKVNDPLVNLAAGIEQELKVYRESEKVLIQKDRDLKLIYCQAMSEMTNNQLAPDANSTIRFTYGSVEGYYPQDGIFYLPQTTLKGLIDKDQGEYPFQVPEQIKILYQKGDFGRYSDQNIRDLPACFLNTTNVTGGNSGSPVLNSRGELIGLVFDMTYESIIGDYYILPEYQRTINVDVRYILFITEKFSGATHLIQEMAL
jgi:hypothetical protein